MLLKGMYCVMRSGKRASSVPKSVSTVVAWPASRGGCRTQRPMRGVMKADRQRPSNTKRTVPSLAPVMVPSQATSMPPASRTHSARKRTSKASSPMSPS